MYEQEKEPLESPDGTSNPTPRIVGARTAAELRELGLSDDLISQMLPLKHPVVCFELSLFPTHLQLYSPQHEFMVRGHDLPAAIRDAQEELGNRFPGLVVSVVVRGVNDDARALLNG
jgi:hypothetical protein